MPFISGMQVQEDTWCDILLPRNCLASLVAIDAMVQPKFQFLLIIFVIFVLNVLEVAC